MVAQSLAVARLPLMDVFEELTKFSALSERAAIKVSPGVRAFLPQPGNQRTQEIALIGNEGDGWKPVTAELAFERSGPERIYSSVVLLDAWVRHVQAVGRADDATLAAVGGFTARLATLRAMSIACTARLALGESPVVEASLVKDLGTSFEQELPAAIGDDLAGHPDEAIGAELYRALLYVTQIAPSFSLRGGTREILRGIIARGLGLR